MLQLVNSAFFGPPRPTASIKEAVVLIGTKTLRTLVLSVEAFRDLELGSSAQGLDATALQEHAATTARLAAEMVPVADSEAAYSAGLLYSIGLLALAFELRDDRARIVAEAQSQERSLLEVEKLVLGVDHGQVAAALLSLWGLRHDVIEAVASWQPGQAPYPETRRGTGPSRGLGLRGARHVFPGRLHGCAERYRGRARSGQVLGESEQQLDDSRLPVARDLLAHIPRLEEVAETIGASGGDRQPTSSRGALGVQLLAAAADLDDHLQQGLAEGAAVTAMSHDGRHSDDILRALDRMVLASRGYVEKSLVSCRGPRAGPG